MPEMFVKVMRGASVLGMMLALCPSLADAHGDMRGILQPPVYGGALKCGALFWSEPRDEVYVGTEHVSTGPRRTLTDLYLGAGIMYGIGPNTLVGLYVPYDVTRTYTDGHQVSERKGLRPSSLLLQQRVWRHDGAGSRIEAATIARGFFFSPGQEGWPEFRPTNYLLGAGVSHSGLSDIASISAAYVGAGHEASFGASWQATTAVHVRPTRAFLRHGRDLFVGVESTYRTSVNGRNQRLVFAPAVEFHPVPTVSFAASYGWPLWEKAVPSGLGGGSSLWISAYVQR
jgi:hypothetical protein